MAKIDWTPGQGRRGRPLRRVLGMGQRQGLLVMYGIAAVAVLFAAAAALGAFNGGAKTTGAAGADANPDGKAAGAPSAVPKDSSKASQLLLGSVQHYAGLLASGQKIVGHTHYSSVAAYGQAFSNPNSPAAAFAKFRTSPNPEGDVTYLNAERQAASAYGGDHGDILDKWSRDMAQAKSDLGDWVAAAAQYQRGALTQSALDAAAGTVTQDLATAKADAVSLSG